MLSYDRPYGQAPWHFNRHQGVATLEGCISNGDDCVRQLDNAKRVAIPPGLSTERVKPGVNFDMSELRGREESFASSIPVSLAGW